jgi:hypothetical protein
MRKNNLNILLEPRIENFLLFFKKLIFIQILVFFVKKSLNLQNRPSKKLGKAMVKSPTPNPLSKSTTIKS